MRYSWILLFIPTLLAADIPPSDPDDAEAFEDAIENIEGLRLDLNSASAEDLRLLPWFSKNDVERIRAHRQSIGPFKRVTDLRDLEGLHSDTVDSALPYLFVTNADAPSPLHIGSTLRVTRSGSADGGFETVRLSHRVQIRRAERWDLRLLHERDPGEAFGDHFTGYLSIRNAGPFHRIVLGDFRPGFGQGLVFSRRGRSSASVESARSQNSGVVGSASSDEDGAFRGVFIETGLESIRWAIFASRSTWDAKVDSTGAFLRSGGDHVSETQKSYQGALSETAAGTRLEGNIRRMRLGVTAISSNFSSPLDGRHNRLALGSADIYLQTDRFALFGEASLPGVAWMAGAKMTTGELTVTMVSRRYSEDFRSVRAAPFASYSGGPTNERGIFLNSSWRPSRGLRVQASVDRHRRLVPKKTPLPETGERYKLKIASKRLSLQISSQREDDITGGIVGNRTRQRARGTLSLGSVPIRLRLWSEVGRGSSPARGGSAIAAGSELRLRSTGPLQLSSWASVFRVTEWEARVYSFHPDVWGGSRMDVLSGAGFTSGIRGDWRGERLAISGRVSLKRTDERMKIGWGVQIEGRR